MSRTGTQENKQASATDAANASAANAASMAAVNKYNTDVGTLRAGNNIAQDPFATPKYLQNENLDYTTTANATANAAKANIANTALRTGDNSASYLSAIQNNQRAAQRAANTGLNQQHSQDYLNNLQYQQQMLNSDLAPAGITNSLYGTSIGGQDSSNSNLTQLGLAGYGPWNAAIGAAGAAAGAACPAEGSLILMADGSKKLVQTIGVGELVMSPDGGGDEVLGNEPSVQECVELRSGDGKAAQCSDSHSLLLHFGGYVFAKDALCRLLFRRPQVADSTVVSIERIGKRTVRHLKLKRNHAYCADGFWALE